MEEWIGKHYILKNCQVIEVDLLTWGIWIGKIKNKRIAQTYIDDYRISTVFLGLDHRFESEGPPILFETMVFKNSDDDYSDLEMERYSTYSEAEQGHQRMVDKVKAGEVI